MTNIADIDLDAVETLARSVRGGNGDLHLLDLVARARSCHASTERLALLARIAVIVPLVAHTDTVPMSGGRRVVIEAADYPPVEDDLIE